jgi:hypothetical protein
VGGCGCGHGWGVSAQKLRNTCGVCSRLRVSLRLFLQADDYGWGDVGYNNGTALTPNLDMMAAGQHSLRLQRYYSGGTSMQACMQLLAKQCIGSLV